MNSKKEKYMEERGIKANRLHEGLLISTASLEVE
jgi:hypothetical protein